MSIMKRSEFRKKTPTFALMKTTIEKIDLAQYRRTGEGACGASYDNLSDNSLMIKMYNTTFPTQSIFNELDIAKKVYEAGVPSPEPGKLVTDGERYGIMFRKIEGKRSFSRIFADEPERTEEIAREFARLAKGLHSREFAKGTFPDAKVVSRTMLDSINDVSDEERALLGTLIDELPDSNSALHGDFHFGNIVTTLPKGAPLSDPHEYYFIDLGNFGQGCPLLDLAMMISICHYGQEQYIFQDMHIHKEQAEQVLRFFLDEYFFGEDRLVDKWFPKCRNVDEIITAFRPYYCVKAIFIDYAIGYMLPESRISIREELESRSQR